MTSTELAKILEIYATNSVVLDETGQLEDVVVPSEIINKCIKTLKQLSNKVSKEIK